jgi:hypothetical protein
MWDSTISLSPKFVIFLTNPLENVSQIRIFRMPTTCSSMCSDCPLTFVNWIWFVSHSFVVGAIGPFYEILHLSTGKAETKPGLHLWLTLPDWCQNPLPQSRVANHKNDPTSWQSQTTDLIIINAPWLTGKAETQPGLHLWLTLPDWLLKFTTTVKGSKPYQ